GATSLTSLNFIFGTSSAAATAAARATRQARARDQTCAVRVMTSSPGAMPNDPEAGRCVTLYAERRRGAMGQMANCPLCLATPRSLGEAPRVVVAVAARRGCLIRG